MKAYKLIEQLQKLDPMTDVLIDVTDGGKYFKFTECFGVVTFDPDERGDTYTVITPHNYDESEFNASN